MWVLKINVANWSRREWHVLRCIHLGLTRMMLYARVLDSRTPRLPFHLAAEDNTTFQDKTRVAAVYLL